MAELFLPRRVIVGANSFEQLAKLSNDLQMNRVFVLYSKSALRQNLSSMQLQFQQGIFYEMPKGEPTIHMLDKALKQLLQHECDGIIAIGGGSTIDLAKAIAVLVKLPEISLQQLPSIEKIERLPMIAVPTTAGTGSEATKVTVIIDDVKGVKLNPCHHSLIPDVAVLDPLLTLSVPADVTAYTGIDALVHAIEAYVSTNATILSDYYALEAIRLISQHIETVVSEPQNIAAREGMLLGSYYAGIAFSNASTNLAHATGRAIGTKFGLAHGQSVALMHPFVVEYSMGSCRERYEVIATHIGLANAQQLVHYLHQLNETFGVWESAQHLNEKLTNLIIEELTKNALSGNGILTNRQVPTAQHIKQLFIDLRKRLQPKGDLSVWYK